jgi:hypothetical protein
VQIRREELLAHQLVPVWSQVVLGPLLRWGLESLTEQLMLALALVMAK